MKTQNIVKNILIWLAIGLISSLLSHFIIELTYHGYEFEYVWELVNEIRPELFLLGSGVLFVIYTFLATLFGSSLMGGLLLMLFSWLVGISNSLKIIYRAEPIYPNDVQWLTELPFLMEMIGWQAALLIATIIVVGIVLLVILYRKVIKPRKQTTTSINWLRGIGMLLSVGLLFYVSRFNYPGNQVQASYDEHANWVSWSQMTNYDENGFIAGFLYNLNAPPMEMPTNYSRQAIDQIFNEYKEHANAINQNKDEAKTDTNIIYIMNESFADPFNLEGLESNKDPIPNYREIIKETLNGSLLVPGLGGGTANNEFQVLTGVSLEPLAPQITNPFIQMVNTMEDLPSIVNKVKGYDYRATAIHAYNPAFYRRQDVYNELNFDEFIHEENMRYTETLTENHPYISDESIYREMFDVMEETEEVNFLHLVTMQNHGGYTNKYDDPAFEVAGTGSPKSTSGYFQDLKHSDEVLLELIEELENYPEPVLLLFWGDHLPGIYEGEVAERNSAITLRETPFFVYSNEMDLQGDTGMISPIYLNNYVIQALNLEVTPFEALMFNLEDVLQVVDRRMFYDNYLSEAVTSREELSPQALKVLEDYTLLLYDITTGNNYAEELGFFDYIEPA